MQESAGDPSAGTALLGGEAAAGVVGAEAGGEIEDYDEDQEEGSEDYEDEDSLSFDLPVETPKQGVPILVATSLLGAWILLLVAVGAALKGGGRKALVSMPLDADSLLTYRERFRESMDKLEEAWRETPDSVKSTFARYHIPSITGEEGINVKDVWTLIRRQVDGMNRTPAPENSASTDVKWQYAMHLHIVTAFCNSTVLRLHGLTKLDSKLERVRGAALLGDGASSELQTAEDNESMKFEEFLNLMPARIQQQMEGVEVPGTVPRDVGMRLAVLVEALDTYSVEGRYVAMRYDSVLEAYGLALETVKDHDFQGARPITSPVDKIPASAKVLLNFIAERFESSTQNLWSPMVVKACAEQWDTETVNRLLDEVQRGDDDRVQQLLIEKRNLVQEAVLEQPLYKGHILPMSIFLL